MLSLIVAVSENGVIGKNNQLLWRLSADLKQFKALTTNHVIIMGRKTFDSIGKPLPNRTSIIISRQKNIEIKGCLVVDSLQKAVEIAEIIKPNEEIFVIGGGEIYNESLPIADKIYLTEVKTIVEGDTFFPKLNAKDWKEISRNSFHINQNNDYAFDVVELIKAS
jgi:dihydrofolate reductase